MLAALYAVGVVLLAPISFELFQVRVADILLPLSILFGLPAVVGLTLGTVVANFASPFGVVDVIGGTAANFVASFLAWRIGTRHFLGSWIVAILVENLVVTFIVGTYLAYLIPLPLAVGWLGVFVGSVIAMNLAGYGLLQALARRMKHAS